MKRVILLMSVFALLLACAMMLLRGGLAVGGLGAPGDEHGRGEDRFGVKQYGAGGWGAVKAPLPECLVLLIHGVDEPGDLWRNLAPALHGAGIPVARFDYPNDQSIRLSSTFLSTWMPRLRKAGAKQVVLVCHSMGGLVAREYLTNTVHDYRRELQPGRVPRIRTIVMLGTPNHGSPMARFRFLAEAREHWERFLRGDGELLGTVTDGDGAAGTDLLPGSDFLRALNARELPPDVHFAIVAGVVSPLGEDDLAAAAARWRSGLPGALHGAVGQIERSLADVANGMGDGVVSLASTRLAGVDDHVCVPGNHISMVCGPAGEGQRPPPAVPIVLDRVRRTWPGRFPDPSSSKVPQR